MKALCLVCGLRLESRKGLMKSASAVSEISGRAMKDIIAALFAEDSELAGVCRRRSDGEEEEEESEGGPYLCRTCYNLLEQVDAFETHLNRTRESLHERRKTKRSSFSSNPKRNTLALLGSAGSTVAGVSSAYMSQSTFLGQLPPSARVETVLKVEPADHGMSFITADADDYFAEIAGTGFDVLYEELNVKKEIVEIDAALAAEGGIPAGVNTILLKQPNSYNRTGVIYSTTDDTSIEVLPLPTTHPRTPKGQNTSATQRKSSPDLVIEHESYSLPGVPVLVPGPAGTAESIVEQWGDIPDEIKVKVTEMIRDLEKDIDDVPKATKSPAGSSPTEPVTDPQEAVENEAKDYPPAKSCPCLLCKDSFQTTSDLKSHVLRSHFQYRYRCGYTSASREACDFYHVSSEVVLEHAKSHRKGANRKSSKTDKDITNSRWSKSLLSKRSKANRRRPLTLLERVNLCPDQYLHQTPDTAKLPEAVREVAEELEQQLTGLRGMPDRITDQNTSLTWDLAVLRAESANLSFGIPGENKCFSCDLESESMQEKHKHLLSCHVGPTDGNSEPYRCDLCKMSFHTEDSAYLHARSLHADLWKPDHGQKRDPVCVSSGGGNHSTDLFHCRFCTIVSTSELAFWLHTNHRHKRYLKVRCEFCAQLCMSACQFRRHFLVSHADYRYKCLECGEDQTTTFDQIDDFKAHIKEKHQRQRNAKAVKNHVKPLVRNSSQNPDDLIEGEMDSLTKGVGAIDGIDSDHAKKVPKIAAELVTCDLCGKLSRGELFHIKHLYSMHGIEMKVDCGDCGKECQSVRDLEAHRRTEHSVASCHYCGRSFYHAGHLVSHLKQVHEVGNKEDDFICEICARPFPTKAYLRTHMRTHNEKKIKCQLCSKMFRWESALTSHLAAVHGQHGKLHSCEFCGKQFKDKSNLKSHRYTHLDVKPHSCQKCGRGFIRKDVMQSHQKNCRP